MTNIARRRGFNCLAQMFHKPAMCRVLFVPSDITLYQLSGSVAGITKSQGSPPHIEIRLLEKP